MAEIENVEKISKSIDDPQVLEALNAQLNFKQKIENNTSLIKDISMGAFDNNKFKKFSEEHDLLIKDYKISSLKQNDIFEDELLKEFF